MPRTVIIHDPATRKKPEVFHHLPQAPTSAPARVYIVINTVEGVPGAHIMGTFSQPDIAVENVRRLTGDTAFRLGVVARIGEETWEVVPSEVIDTLPE